MHDAVQRHLHSAGRLETFYTPMVVSIASVITERSLGAPLDMCKCERYMIHEEHIRRLSIDIDTVCITNLQSDSEMDTILGYSVVTSSAPLPGPSFTTSPPRPKP